MYYLLLIFLILINFTLIYSTSNSDSSSTLIQNEIYSDVEELDSSESLRKFKELPISYYKFKYDSVPNRVQIGCIGSKVQKLFPEAVEIIPSTSFTVKGKESNSSSNKEKNVKTVTNFPLINKDIIYMYGLSSLKELIKEYDEINNKIKKLYQYEKKIINYEENFINLINNKIVEQNNIKNDINILKNKKNNENILKDNNIIEKNNKLNEKLNELNNNLLNYYNNHLIIKLNNYYNNIINQYDESIKYNENKLKKYENELNQLKNNEKLLNKTINNNKLNDTKLLNEKNLILKKIKLNENNFLVNNNIKNQQNLLNLNTKKQEILNYINFLYIIILNFINFLLINPRKIILLFIFIFLLLLFLLFIKEFLYIFRNYIQKNIGKPKLIRETSYNSSLLYFIILYLKKKLNFLFNTNQNLDDSSHIYDDFSTIILEDSLKNKIIQLALATFNTHKSGAPYRHVLLHGPPGTGKTLIARQLALSCGLDYAIMSGGDVGPLGEEAVNEFHSLFAWAKKSEKGLLLFIDEAEAFLASRLNQHNVNSSDSSIEIHLRNALNALLYQTGTPSNKFMLVLATNRPEELDEAILDRVDVSLQIPLPLQRERVLMCQFYMKNALDELIEKNKQNKINFSIDPDCLSDEKLNLIGNITVDFSGREISKLFISVQHALLLLSANSSDILLDWSILSKILIEKKNEHDVKKQGFSNINNSTIIQAPSSPIHNHSSLKVPPSPLHTPLEREKTKTKKRN